MYNEVENRFREEAFSRKFSKLNMILFICYILFSLLSFKIFESKIAVGSVIIYCLVFYLIIYVYKYVKLRQNNIKNNIFCFEKNDKNFEQLKMEKDEEILQNIIECYNINSKDKIKEALRHYQSIAPRATIERLSFSSIISIALSIVSLLLGEPVYNSPDMQQIVIVFLLMVVIYIMIINYVLSKVYIFRGSDLYMRIESLLSAIYMQDKNFLDNRLVKRINIEEENNNAES